MLLSFSLFAGNYGDKKTGEMHSEKHDSKSIVQHAQESGQFNTLLTAVKKAGLEETLSGEGNYTIFAPTDAAFAKLPKAQLQTLLNNPEQLKQVLLYHVAPARVSSAQAKNMSSASTVSGETIALRTSDNSVMVNNAKVITADINASNGVIHAIDTVLIPEKMSE